MPVITSTYKAPRFLRNPHVHTILCSTLRQRPRIPYIRERLELDDGDFLDLDWSEIPSRKLVILSHGMEGSSQSKYMLHTAQYANNRGYSALAWNMRGCSGHINRKLHFYHSGKSEDLAAVVHHAIRKGYQEIFLAGFSLGGNVTLVYLGRAARRLPKAVKSAVAVSAPVDLSAAQEAIEAPRNRIYLKRFLLEFKKKFEDKRRIRGLYIDVSRFNSKVKTLAKLDAKYTAPWNGFKDEQDYYTRSSAIHVLKDISIPALLLNPRDDTFLAEACYPQLLAEKSPNFFLEVPDAGGHCAMLSDHRFKASFMETRIIDFFEKNLRG